LPHLQTKIENKAQGEKEMKDKIRCIDCEHWTPTISKFIGECGPDMETKMAHQTCAWAKPRVKRK